MTRSQLHLFSGTIVAVSIIAAAQPAQSAAPAFSVQDVATDPDANEIVDAPLPMIHVLFPRPVDMKSAGMTVTRDGKVIDVGKPTPMGTDGKLLMAIPKTPLPTGKYVVKWHVLSTDGKPMQGEFSFTVK